MKTKNLKSVLKGLLTVFIFTVLVLACEEPDKDLEIITKEYSFIDKDSIKEEDI